MDGAYRTTKGENLNIKDREHFQQAISGQPFVSDPLVSKSDNSVIVTYAVPLKTGDKITGVLVAVRDGNELSQIVKDITFSQTGVAFMINNKGTTVAHQDPGLVLDMYNITEKVQEDASLTSLANVEKLMMARETGAKQYEESGVAKYLGYAPVEGTNWSIGISVLKTDVLAGLSSLVITTSLYSLLFLLIALVIAYVVSQGITKSLSSTVQHLSSIAEGNLSVEIPEKFLRRKDEVGILARSLKTTQESFRGMVKNIKDTCYHIENESEGLAASSEQMTSLAQNVTGVMQNIAQGTEAQANHLSEMNGVINDFGSQLDNVVLAIKEIEDNSSETNRMAGQSNQNMQVMVESVDKIRRSYEEFTSKVLSFGSNIQQINEISNLINSIADQTDLLALNAAIEAARAGEAGRGFAVVADEIRKLAEQSKGSAGNISGLISTISADTHRIVQTTDLMNNDLNKQMEVINTTIESFKKITQAIREMGPKIEAVNVSAATLEQDKSTILQKLRGSPL
jgi:methyl-accepting chemotaxis protein